MLRKKTQKCGNTGSLCLDKPVLGQRGGGGLIECRVHTSAGSSRKPLTITTHSRSGIGHASQTRACFSRGLTSKYLLRLRFRTFQRVVPRAPTAFGPLARRASDGVVFSPKSHRRCRVPLPSLPHGSAAVFFALALSWIGQTIAR